MGRDIKGYREREKEDRKGQLEENEKREIKYGVYQ